MYNIKAILPALIFFAVLSGVRSKCTPTSSAARLEDELKEEGARELLDKTLWGKGDVLSWNCTAPTTEATPADTWPSEETEERPYINTYVLVNQKMLQSQDLIDNITLLLTTPRKDQQEEEATSLAKPNTDVNDLAGSSLPVEVTTDDDIDRALASELSSVTVPLGHNEEKPNINTYVLVYRKMLQSQDMIDNITSYVDLPSTPQKDQQAEDAVGLAEPETDVENVTSSTRSPLMVGVVTDVVQPQLERSSGQETITEGSSGAVSRMLPPVIVVIGEDNGVVVLNVSHPASSVFLNKTRLKVYSSDRHKTKDVTFLAGSGTILRSGVSQPVVSTGVDGPLSLAVDSEHDRLYWLSTRHRTLEAVDLDGTNRTLLVDNIQDVTFPNNLAVDPYQRYIFFVANRNIYRTNLDGKELTQMRLNGNYNRGVKCLTLDAQKKRIFFSGRVGGAEGTPYLASVGYDGEDHRDHPLGRLSWSDVFALTVLNDAMYLAVYSPGQADTLWSIELSNNAASPKRLYESSPERGVRSM